MSLLCDIRNFQYTIAQINGLYIRMEGQSARISIPESQYDLIVKSMLTSNDYVFSLASLEFDDTCPSHLVAIENENLGSYASKVVNFDSESSNPTENSISPPRPKSKPFKQFCGKIPGLFFSRVSFSCFKAQALLSSYSMVL